jgi:phospholipase/carboxylesterase
MPRFFRRIREGVFDENDLRLRADELVAFLAAAEQQYAVAAGSWLAVGFSNGANIASALLLRHPESLAGAVLFAAMVPFQALLLDVWVCLWASWEVGAVAAEGE